MRASTAAAGRTSRGSQDPNTTLSFEATRRAPQPVVYFPCIGTSATLPCDRRALPTVAFRGQASVPICVSPLRACRSLAPSQCARAIKPVFADTSACGLDASFCRVRTRFAGLGADVARRAASTTKTSDVDAPSLCCFCSAATPRRRHAFHFSCHPRLARLSMQTYRHTQPACHHGTNWVASVRYEWTSFGLIVRRLTFGIITRVR